MRKENGFRLQSQIFDREEGTVTPGTRKSLYYPALGKLETNDSMDPAGP